MCGIAGFIHKNECDEACTKIENKIQKLQECRGPDAHSTWTETEKGVTYHLYHQRLRIQDLSPAADQPMHSTENPKSHIVFNGEIYNVDEIRSAFLSSHELRTHSDTEILIEALSLTQPKEVLARIRGMFAFGLLNSDRNTLLLARDRFGEKPLHFWREESRLVFASQFDSIVDSMKILGLPIKFDQEAIYEYLIYGYFPHHTSLVKGVEKLAPNSIIQISFDYNFKKPKQELWSTKWQSKTPVNMTFDKLEAELEEAIKLQLIGDVPIGVFLSGGCDSTLVSAIAQKLNKNPIHSFSLGFESKAFDESRYALQAAKEIGTQHHALTMTAEDAANILPMVLKAYPEPLGDPSVLPTTFISREAKKHVTVVLTGDGADELFFGYGRYGRYLQLTDLQTRIPFSNSAIRVLNKISKWALPRYKQIINRIVFASKNTSPEERYMSLIGFLHMNAVLDTSSFAKVSNRSLAFLWSKKKSGEPINYLREIDIDSYLTDDILVKVDRAAMAFALETRAPFLDMKISQLASIANDDWLNSKEQKRVIKKVLEKYVSSSVFQRPKMGFGAPLNEWFSSSLHTWADDIVNSFDWKMVGIDSKFVANCWNNQNRSNTEATYLWMLLALAHSVKTLRI